MRPFLGRHIRRTFTRYGRAMSNANGGTVIPRRIGKAHLEEAIQRILRDGVPRQAEHLEARHVLDFRSDGPAGEWTWHGPVPEACGPSYSEEGTTKRVVLYARNPIGQDTIYRATDTCVAGNYVCKTDTTVLCTAPGGFIY